jgi:hypothetical protein
VQHIRIELVDEGAVGQGHTVLALELRRIHEILRDLEQGHASVKAADLRTQSARIGSAVQCRLIEAVGLACVAVDVEGHRFVEKLQALDVVQRVKSVRAADSRIRPAFCDLVLASESAIKSGIDALLAVDHVIAAETAELVVEGIADDGVIAAVQRLIGEIGDIHVEADIRRNPDQQFVGADSGITDAGNDPGGVAQCTQAESLGVSLADSTVTDTFCPIGGMSPLQLGVILTTSPRIFPLLQA